MLTESKKSHTPYIHFDAFSLKASVNHQTHVCYCGIVSEPITSGQCDSSRTHRPVIRSGAVTFLSLEDKCVRSVFKRELEK